MGAPLPGDPCLEPKVRGPLPGGRPVRVVEILASGTNGGAQEHVYSLLSRLDRTRYEPSVISLSPGSAVRRIARLGIPVHVVDEADDAIAVGAAAVVLADLRAEVVHNHMYRAELVGTRAALALAESGRLRPYVVGTVHSSRVRSAEDRAILAALTPRMDRLVAVSRAMERKIAEERPSATPVSLIYNGVDLVRYDHQEPCCTLREEYGMPADAQVVGIVARLEPEKGHPTLLDAWPLVLRRVPSARLLVVGEGSRRPALEEQAAALGIADRVGISTEVSSTDVPKVLRGFDVLVLPSRSTPSWVEQFGRVLVEAMACGVPVIGSSSGEIPNVIGDAGLVFPEGDVKALRGALARIAASPEVGQRLGEAGRRRVLERYTQARIAEATYRVYREMLGL